MLKLIGNARGGPVSFRRVTAHGGPGRPLQFDWLEAALARPAPRFSQKLGGHGAERIA